MKLLTLLCVLGGVGVAHAAAASPLLQVKDLVDALTATEGTEARILELQESDQHPVLNEPREILNLLEGLFRWHHKLIPLDRKKHAILNEFIYKDKEYLDVPDNVNIPCFKDGEVPDRFDRWQKRFDNRPDPYWDLTLVDDLDDPADVYEDGCIDFTSDSPDVGEELKEASDALNESFRLEREKREELGIGECFPLYQGYPSWGDKLPMQQVKELITHLMNSSTVDPDTFNADSYPVIVKPALASVFSNCVRLQLASTIKLSPQSKETLQDLLLKNDSAEHPPCDYGQSVEGYELWHELYASSSNVFYEPDENQITKIVGDLSDGLYKFKGDDVNQALIEENKKLREEEKVTQNAFGIGDDPLSPIHQVYNVFKALEGTKPPKSWEALAETYPILKDQSAPLLIQCFHRLRFMLPSLSADGLSILTKHLPKSITHKPPCMPSGAEWRLNTWLESLSMLGLGAGTKEELARDRKAAIEHLAYNPDEEDKPSCNIYNFSKETPRGDELDGELQKYMEKREAIHEEDITRVLEGSPRIIEEVNRLITHLKDTEDPGDYEVTPENFKPLFEASNARHVVEALRRLRVRIAKLSSDAWDAIEGLPAMSDDTLKVTVMGECDFFKAETKDLQQEVYKRWVHALLDSSYYVWAIDSLPYAFPDLGTYNTETLLFSEGEDEHELEGENRVASEEIYGEYPLDQAFELIYQLKREVHDNFGDAFTEAGEPKLFEDYEKDNDQHIARFAVMLESLRRLRVYLMELSSDSADLLKDWVNEQVREMGGNLAKTDLAIPCMTGSQLGTKGLVGSFFDFAWRFIEGQMILDSTILGTDDYRPYFPDSKAEKDWLTFHHPERYLCKATDCPFYFRYIEHEAQLQDAYRKAYEKRSHEAKEYPEDYDLNHFPTYRKHPMVQVYEFLSALLSKKQTAGNIRDTFTRDKYPVLYNYRMAPILAECLRLQRGTLWKILKLGAASEKRQILMAVPLLAGEVPDEFLYVETPGIESSKHKELLFTWIYSLQNPTLLSATVMLQKFNVTGGTTTWYRHGGVGSAYLKAELQQLEKEVATETKRRSKTAKKGKVVTKNDLLGGTQGLIKDIGDRSSAVQRLTAKLATDKSGVPAERDKLRQDLIKKNGNVAAVRNAMTVVLPINPNKAAKRRMRKEREAREKEITDIGQKAVVETKKLEDQRDREANELRDALLAHEAASKELDAIQASMDPIKPGLAEPGVGKSLANAMKQFATARKKLRRLEKTIPKLYTALKTTKIGLANAKFEEQLAIRGQLETLVKSCREQDCVNDASARALQAQKTAAGIATKDVPTVYTEFTAHINKFDTQLKAEMQKCKTLTTLCTGKAKILQDAVNEANEDLKTMKEEEADFKKAQSKAKRRAKRIQKAVTKCEEAFIDAAAEIGKRFSIEAMKEESLHKSWEKKHAHLELFEEAGEWATTKAGEAYEAAKKERKRREARSAVGLPFTVATGSREGNLRAHSIRYYQHIEGPRPGSGPGTIVSKPDTTWKARALNDVSVLRAEEPARIAELTSTDFQSISDKASLKNADMSRFPSSALSAYTREDFAQLDIQEIPVKLWGDLGEQIPDGPTHPAHLIDAATLEKLPTSTLKAFTPKFFANLDPSAMEGLTAPQMDSLSGAQLAGLSASHVQHLKMPVWASLTAEVVPQVGTKFALSDPAHPRYQMDKAHVKALPAATRNAVYNNWFNNSAMEYGRVRFGWGIIGLFVAPFIF